MKMLHTALSCWLPNTLLAGSLFYMNFFFPSCKWMWWWIGLDRRWSFYQIAELDSFFLFSLPLFLLLLVYQLFCCCVSRHKQCVTAAWLYYDGFDAMIAMSHVVRNVQATQGTRGPQCKGSQASVHAANATQFMPQGRLRNQHPTPLYSPLCVSLVLKAYVSPHFTSVNMRRRGDASYTQKYVSGYWVMLCCNVKVEGNKASAHREGEKETVLLILFNPSWDIQN